MEKCILCDQPLPARTAKTKTGKDLVCLACNQSILQAPDEDDSDEDDDEYDEKEAEEFGKRLDSLERLIKEMKGMIETNPDAFGESEELAEEFPKELQPFIFTPLKSYKMMEMLLAIAKGEQMESILKQDSEVRLENALKMSIEKEDYKKSAVLRDKIKAKKDKKEKKVKPDKK